MTRTWRRVLLLIMALLLPLACVFTEPFRAVPSPTTSRAPLGEVTPEPVASQGTTDQEGKVLVVDSQGSEQAILQVKDEDSGAPVSGVEVYFLQRGSNYLAVAVDPESRYLASWSQGSLEELSKSSSSLPTGRSFFRASPAYAQPLPLVLLLVKAVSKVSSLQDLIAFLQDPPNLVHWGVLYEDRCWTGEQLANYVGLAGLILPGIDDVAGVLTGGMDEIAKAIFLLSQHVIEEDAKQSLLGLDRPVRIRTYHLGIPILGMVPVGWCELEATPSPTARPVPPEDTPVAPQMSCGFGWNRPIVYSCMTIENELQICAVCPNGSGPIQLTTSKDAGHFFPAWSPDGQWIGFTFYRDGNEEILVMHPDGSRQTQLTFNEGDHLGPVWAPDSRSIAFIFAGREGEREILVMRADGSEQTQLTLNDAQDSQPSWSPDSQWIAFTSDRDGDDEIFIMRADGSEQTQLTFNDDTDFMPSWSPDGQWIAFLRDHYGDLEMYVMRADGSAQTQLTYKEIPDLAVGSWSPDSRWITFSSVPEEQRLEEPGEIYIMRRDGSQRTRLTFNDTPDISPTWSPDGEWIAFASQIEDGEGRGWDIFVIRRNGSDLTQLTFNGNCFFGFLDW